MIARGAAHRVTVKRLSSGDSFGTRIFMAEHRDGHGHRSIVNDISYPLADADGRVFQWRPTRSGVLETEYAVCKAKRWEQCSICFKKPAYPRLMCGGCKKTFPGNRRGVLPSHDHVVRCPESGKPGRLAPKNRRTN
jgi:hypothetical protein